jgi:16S rRNA (cytosine967-C5)-methyltransferase
MKTGGRRKISPARSIALQVLRRIEAEGAFSSLALNHALRRHATLSPEDRALATELTYGTLRWRRRLDFALSAHSHRRLEKVEPSLLRILRLSAYQLMFLDSIPDWAAVDQGTQMAVVMRGRRAAGYVNGVLRGLAGNRERIEWPDVEKNPEHALAVMHSFPDWLVKWWLQRFGKKRAEEFMQALNLPAPLWVRANSLRGKPDKLVSLIAASGYHATPSDLVPGAVLLQQVGDVTALAAHQEGWFHVQDLAAQAVCHLLAPKSGQRILDACGAPGGKTATLAQLTGDQGEILSVDIHPARIGLVRRLAERLRITSVRAVPHDLTQPAPEEWGAFDRVLLDAPCSSMGVLRRHPEIRWRLAPDDLAHIAQTQRELLDSVAGLVKPGGTLVYSVCTFTEEEGPGQIEAFLSEHPEFERIDPLAGKKAPWHAMIDDTGALATWPDVHNADAFYAVRMQKKQ